MKRWQTAIPWWCGAAVLALGTFVLVGWFIERAGMVQLQSHMVAMVANTALCFVMSGAGLLLLAYQRMALHSAVRTLAVIVGLLAAAVLLEALIPVPWVLDSPAFHSWLDDGNQSPGRMAPNTCVGFVLAAIALWTLASPENLDQRSGLRVVLFALLLTGLTGFVGYWLRTDVVLAWRHVRMALPTASGMLVLAGGLWSVLENRSTLERSPERQITRSAALVLTVAVLVAGLSGFAVLVGQTESAIQDRLRQGLEFRVALLEEALHSARDANAAVMSNDALIELSADLLRSAPSSATDRLVGEPPPVLPGSGLRGLRLTTPGGAVLAEQGVMAPATDFEVPLDRAGGTSLVWDGILVLRTQTSIHERSGAALTNVVLERALPSLAGQLTGAKALGRSGAASLCARHLHAGWSVSPD